MALPALVAGSLPMGRWPTTVDEIEATFVAGQSSKRAQLWSDWLELTAALREVLPAVPAAWLSGSFLTDHQDPGDVDSVYIIEWPVLKGVHANAERAAFVGAVADNKVKELFGLSVDSFILEWWPAAGTLPRPWARQYRDQRGYWDDLWSRQRSKDPREDSIPRRGYVEVILDGYV